jgi:hypothetical protein
MVMMVEIVKCKDLDLPFNTKIIKRKSFQYYNFKEITTISVILKELRAQGY